MRILDTAHRSDQKGKVLIRGKEMLTQVGLAERKTLHLFLL